jgi:hypothetical protein
MIPLIVFMRIIFVAILYIAYLYKNIAYLYKKLIRLEILWMNLILFGKEKMEKK